MAWTAPTTFVSGNVLTAAQLNTNVRDNTNYLHSPPGCLGQRTANQSITNNTLTTISFNAADIYDTDSMHDAAGAPNNIIINTAGVYRVYSSLQFAANATGIRRLVIVYTGIGEMAGTQDTGPTAGINTMLETEFHYLFPAGVQTNTAQVIQTSGGALNVTTSSATTLTGNPPVCYFGAQWISDGT